jgi:hypothetical protein
MGNEQETFKLVKLGTNSDNDEANTKEGEELQVKRCNFW